MKYIYTFLFMFFSLVLFADDKYVAENLPKELFSNSNAVVRLYQKDLFLSKNKSVTKIKLAITFLNASGLSAGVFFESYDKYSSVKVHSIIYYDGKGKRIRKASSVEVKDYCEQDYFTVASDVRIKFHRPTSYQFPYTIEYEYELINKHTFFAHNWTPYFDNKVSVEKSTFTVHFDNDDSIKYKAINCDTNRVKSIKNNTTTLTWTITNYNPPPKDIYMPDFHTYTPCVYVQYQYFKFGKYTGNASSWEQLGNFVYCLTRQKNTVSDKTKREILELVKSESNPTSKIKKIYEYVQSHTRYVNISYGLGGLCPLKSELVDKTGWGDCKALTNYTKTLLALVGIPSYAAIVRAGEFAPEIVTDLVSSQFNHVILCVPTNRDTIWLECTSQTMPFGFLSDFTDNRWCLVLKDSASFLSRTPEYQASGNTSINQCSIEIRVDSVSTMYLRSKNSGLSYSFYEYLTQISNEDQLKQLNKKIFIPSFKIKSFKIELDKSMKPTAQSEYKIDIQQLGSTKNGQIVFTPSILNKQKCVFTEQKRDIDICIRRGEVVIDSLAFIIPQNYSLQAVPENTSLVSQFGTFSASFSVEGNKILYIRKENIIAGSYSYSNYTELKKYLLSIERCDNQKIILTQK